MFYLLEKRANCSLYFYLYFRLPTIASNPIIALTIIEAISETLTHSDTITTKTYVNTSNVIPMAVGEIAYRNLKK